MIFPRLKPRARVKAILKENLLAEFSPRFVIVSVGYSKGVIAEFTLRPRHQAIKQTTVSFKVATSFIIFIVKKYNNFYIQILLVRRTLLIKVTKIVK